MGKLKIKNVELPAEICATDLVRTKMNIQFLVVEVTRRCNMSCEHCLRGDAENKNIDLATTESFLDRNNIGYISNVTFTGGEPTLNLPGIWDFLNACRKRKIEIGSFYMAINGTNVSDEFMHLVMELYLYCDDNETSGIDVSNTDWHNCQDMRDKDGIKKLFMLNIAHERPPLNYQNVISEGRGEQLNEYNGVDGRTINPEPLEIEDGELTTETIYLNVNGDICTDCDLSYEHQEQVKIGNVFVSSLEEMVQQKEEVLQ